MDCLVLIITQFLEKVRKLNRLDTLLSLNIIIESTALFYHCLSLPHMLGPFIGPTIVVAAVVFVVVVKDVVSSAVLLGMHMKGSAE